MRLTITVKGGRELAAAIKKLGDKFYDFADEFKQIGGNLVNYYGSKPFVSEGRIFGAAWAPLNPLYEVEKAKRYPGRNILVRTGRMSSGYTFTSSVNAVRVWNQRPYAKFHQTGTEKMPKRVIVSFNDEIARMVKEMINRSVVKKLNSV